MTRTRTLSPPDAQTLERAHDVLAAPRRRAVVEALAEREPPIPLRELAGAISDIAVSDEIPSPETDELLVALHHVHLPVLDEANCIEYDAETNTVTRRYPEHLQCLENAADIVR